MTRSKYVSLLITITVVIILISFLPIIVDRNTSEMLISITTVMGGICSIGGIIFGFIIYRKLGIDETILLKQSEVVFAFVEELRNTRLRVITKTETLYISFYRLHQISKIDFYLKFNNYPILIQSSSLSYIHRTIINYSDNLFLPMEIAKTLKEFDDFYILQKGEFSVDLHARVVSNDIQDDGDFLLIPKITLGQFFKRLDSVTSATLNWIEKHSSSQSLNFPNRFI